MRRPVATVVLLLTLAGAAQADTFEPNDTQETAYGPLESGMTYESYISAGDPADWYTVQVEPGNISIQLDNLPSGTDYDLLLWDSNGILFASQNESTTPESIQAFITQSQQLWIQVESVFGTSDVYPYELTATFVEPPPNTHPSLTLHLPTGSETWLTGSTELITWTANDAEDGTNLSIDLEASFDAGNTWQSIVSGLSNSGSHSWLIPDMVSTQTIVRAHAIDSKPDTTTKSSGMFTVRHPNSIPVVSLLTPNGGEVWTAGTVEDILWTASDAEDGSNLSIDLAYSVDAGSTWMEIAGGLENTGTYGWVLPDTASDAMLVRLSARDSEPDTTHAHSADLWVLEGIPNSPPSVALLSPNGGESFTGGDSMTVSYTADDHESPGALNVEIHLSLDRGKTWSQLLAGSATGSHRVLLPFAASDSALVRLTVEDPQGSSARDTSDTVFSIALPAMETPLVRLGTASDTYLSQVSIPLYLDNAAPESLSLALGVPHSRVTLETITGTPRCQDCVITYQVTETGLNLQVSTDLPGGIPLGTGPLAELTFRILSAPGNSIPLSVESAVAVDVWDRELSTDRVSGWIRVIGDLPSVSLELAPVTAAVAETIRVPVHADFAAPLDSLRFLLGVDRSFLQWESLDLGPQALAWDVSATLSGDSLSVLFSGGTVPMSSDVLCTLVFVALAGPETPLQWHEAQAWGPGGVLLTVNTTDAMVTPVSILSFSALDTPGGTLLSWDILGDAEHIEVMALRNDGYGMESISSWIPSTRGNFRDATVEPGTTVTYQLVFRTRSGELSYSRTVVISLPTAFQLSPPYPNPSRGSIRAPYRGTVTTADIYDLQGRLVKRLATPDQPVGILEWDGRSDHGTAVAPGIYFLRVMGPVGIRVQRIVRTP